MFTMRRLILITIFAFGVHAQAEETKAVPAPTAKDTCPVCGMFVAKYPEWIATVLYKDGHAHHFDGAKDYFKYLHDLDKWAPGHQRDQIQSMVVTEYYELQKIDAKEAFYVIGSVVLGPMGHELVPLRSIEDAEEFKADHKGVRIVQFEEVSAELPYLLDKGRFEP